MAVCNASELLANASCFQCLSKKELQMVIVQLLCDINASGGGGGGSGSGQIRVYTTDPNAEAITPADTALPAVAYSDDGSGAHYGWKVATQTWV